jgi:hypothetical protein
VVTTIGQRIIDSAIEILDRCPDGVRYSELVRQVSEGDPSLKINTVHGTVWNLDQQFPDRIYKPTRGLFRLTKYAALETGAPELAAEKPAAKPQVKEEDFYAPFADWLENDLEECTKAIPLGGSRFKDKWGTPDVLGKWESRRSDIIQAPTEIVSAEIKLDSSQLITAFGQAAAYRLFSHRTYLVVPVQSGRDEIARLDSLCSSYGIGLVVFDATSPADPGFQIRVRAAKAEPDMFYMNRYLKLVEKELFS